MRRGTTMPAMRFHAMMIVVAILATAANSQSRTQNSPRVRSRPDMRQSQVATSQAGQPDFARRMAERHARNMAEMQQDMEQMRRWAEENRNRAIQQALGAPDDQWGRLKPVLDRIERLKAEAEVAAGPNATDSFGGNGMFQGQGFMFGGVGGSGGGGGGGRIDVMDSNAPSGSRTGNWSGAWTSGPKSVMEMTEGEILCRELQQLLQGQSAPPAQVAQKVAALRRIRTQARADLAQARQTLRELMLPQQEPALIVMGYLD